MKKVLFSLGMICSSLHMYAQPLKSVTGIRIYEHHSVALNGKPGGYRSGFDFATNRYFGSLDTINMWKPWAGNEKQHLDMVEDGGPYGGNVDFAFTSGISKIWGPDDIQGNGLTKYMEAPLTFNYDMVTDVADIQAAYKAASAKTLITPTANKVYLAQIRNTNRYVALKITAVKNKNTPPNDNNIYFDFNYKYGDYVKNTTSVNTVGSVAGFTISPNPSKDFVTIQFVSTTSTSTLAVYSATGQAIVSYPDMETVIGNNSFKINMSSMPTGIYYAEVKTGETVSRKAFVKQ